MDQRPNLRDWLRSLPNQLTLARLGGIPFLLLLYPLDFFALNVFCTLVFAAAAVTDYLDGYLARKWHSTSRLGALLDPIADKMLVAAALFVLAYAHAVPPVVAGLMICRDIGISGLRLMALEQNLAIAVNELGKAKTVLQFVAIVCLLLNRDVYDLPVRSVGMVALWLALILSLWSAYTYVRAYWAIAKDSIVAP